MGKLSDGAMLLVETVEDVAKLAVRVWQNWRM